MCTTENSTTWILLRHRMDFTLVYLTHLGELPADSSDQSGDFVA
jgi:hypothetical protein